MLIARGSQDEYLSGNPDVSFFKSVARKHTNFAQTTDRQTIQGNVQNGGLSTVRFERKGDLLSYVYLTPIDGSGTWTRKTGITDWSTLISKCEILVGGQVIDEMDSHFIQHIARRFLPTTIPRARRPVFPAKTPSSRCVSGSAKIGPPRSRWLRCRITTSNCESRGVRKRRTTT